MKIVRFVLLVAVLVASGFFVTQDEPVQAQREEIGTLTCADLNDPGLDSVYPFYAFSNPFEFMAGDTIKLVADFTNDPLARQESAESPYVIELWLNDQRVKTAPFPGQITYMFSSDTSIPTIYPSVGWQVISATETSVGAQRAAAENGVYPVWTVSCTSVEQETAQAVPGCDLGVELTDNAAVGAFVWTTDVYWAPDVNATTGLTFEAGKTAWVLGVDASGEFYQFVWSCNLLWAPVGTMGPNFDAVWNGTPLPTTVVE